jgi:hypothetical protein
MSRRFSPSAWLAALALLALSMMSAPARSQPVEGAHTFNCYGRFFGTHSCVSTFRGGWRHPHVIAVPGPQSAEERAAADARDRRWANRCRPVTHPDRYGMQRYRYAESGCEFGIYD